MEIHTRGFDPSNFEFRVARTDSDHYFRCAMMHCDEIHLGPRKLLGALPEDEWLLVDGEFKDDYELVEGSASELAMDPRAVTVQIVLGRGARLQLKLQSWEAGVSQTASCTAAPEHCGLPFGCRSAEVPLLSCLTGAPVAR